ncbi:hypothetical protein N7456_010775 [Penicillium angulare]|uniref:Uncharacterized protein n=1 Tax=Penicillium angulare TaxID=116970 RepID=A0A9W9ESR4_9EURO|nr:hypothetical protein N7456_010775 [Penicillium angulare]
MFYRKPRATKTTTTKPTLMTRLRGPGARKKTVKTTTTTTPHASHRTTKHHHVAHHHKRKVTFGDKVSGAMLKMKGSLTGRPGVKVSDILVVPDYMTVAGANNSAQAAGTRRMHGTDGRGSHYHAY